MAADDPDGARVQPAVEAGLRRPDRDVGPAVTRDVADERDAAAEVRLLLERESALRREVGMEPVRIALVPEVGEVDVLALRLAVDADQAASARDVQGAVGRTHRDIAEAVAVDVAERGHGVPRVRVLDDAVVAAADRRVGGGADRIVGQAAAGVERGRGDVAGIGRAEDDVDGAAAALARSAGHRRADHDVVAAVVVHVLARDREPEHLARVTGDRVRGRAPG